MLISGDDYNLFNRIKLLQKTPVALKHSDLHDNNSLTKNNMNI